MKDLDNIYTYHKPSALQNMKIMTYPDEEIEREERCAL